MLLCLLYALSVSNLVSKVFAPDGGFFPLEGFPTGFFSEGSPALNIVR